MQYAEFEVEINRLRSVFGDKAMPDEKVKIIWERVKNFPQSSLTKSVDVVIAEDHRPTLSNIGAYLGSNPEVEKAKALANWDCSHCGQSGFVEATNRYTKNKTAFKCSCVFGIQIQSKRIPEWHQDFSIHFIPDFYNFNELDSSKPKKIMHEKNTPERAKKLAEVYLPGIRSIFRSWEKNNLPYDQNERLEDIPF